MSPNPFQRLLAKAEAGPLSADEEQELARWLADPAYRAIFDQQLASARKPLARMLAYQTALQAEPSTASAAARAQFEQTISALRAESRRGASPPRGRVVPFAALLAAAAAVAFLLWFAGPNRVATGPIELALMARDPSVRGPAAETRPNLGHEWRIIEMRDLPGLAEWTQQELPRAVRARVWIDEEREVLRAVTRDGQGKTVSLSQPLNRTEPVDAQLRKLAAQFEPR